MKSRAEWLFPVGLGVALGLAILCVALLRTPEPRGRSHGPSTSAQRQLQGPSEQAPPQELAGLQAEIKELRSGRRALERRTNELEKELQTLRAQLPDDPDPSDASVTPEEEDQRAATQTQNQLAMLENTLMKETRDPAWTGTAELAITKLFHQEEMAGMQLASAQCRTTLCRIDLLVDDSTEPEEAFHQLALSTPWPGQAFYRFDPTSGEAQMFLGREGYELPHAPQ